MPATHTLPAQGNTRQQGFHGERCSHLVARWADLCVVLDDYLEGYGAVVVGFRPLPNSLPSAMEAEGIVLPGDVLVALNGTDVRALPFAEIDAGLHDGDRGADAAGADAAGAAGSISIEWPLTMRFWRPTTEQAKAKHSSDQQRTIQTGPH